MSCLALIKIGGGLITDKSKPYTVRDDMMRAAAEALSRAVIAHPEMSFIIGNGAGSFGHFAATAKDESTSETKYMADIHQSVAKLNVLFVQQLLERDIPAFSLSPASCITCENGDVESVCLDSVKALLTKKLVPVIFGDIVPDATLGGTILSTESLFEAFGKRLLKEYDEMTVIYAGDAPGVLDKRGAVIPRLTAHKWKAVEQDVGGSSGFDVTGGMRHKVESAFRMAHLAKSISIVSCKAPDVLLKVLEGEQMGTRIVD